MGLIDVLTPRTPPEPKGARVVARWTSTGLHEVEPLDAKSRPGEINGQAKLTTDKVRQIRALAARREELRAELAELSNVRIARRMGVSDSVVGDVIAGRRWGHVE